MAFVTNNSFVDEIAFDGMRKRLAQDFDEIYVLDLGGNVRKNPKLSGTTHNVFGIQVGVSISFFIRKAPEPSPVGADPCVRPGSTLGFSERTKFARIFYAALPSDWRKEQKYDFLDQQGDYSTIPWQEIQPDKHYTWLTEGLSSDFESFLPIGTKVARAGKENAIFRNYGRGIASTRDAWVYNFNSDYLLKYRAK